MLEYKGIKYSLNDATISKDKRLRRLFSYANMEKIIKTFKKLKTLNQQN